MRFGFDFSVRSELRIEDGNWPQLKFCRQGFFVAVDKPLVVEKVLLSSEVLSTNPKAIRGSEAGDVAFFLRLRFEMTPVGENIAEDSAKAPSRLAWIVLDDLLSWIRVLTRQYWIGYRERFVRDVGYEAWELGDNPRKLTGSAKMGRGFEYGQPLTSEMWRSVQLKLAAGKAPRSSELFFCDALLDISEADISQALIALGSSCEIELENLVSDLVSQLVPRAADLFERYARYPFKEGLKIPKYLGGMTFGEFDNKAAHTVGELYDLRGKAIHGGDIPDGVNIVPFIQGSERLFEWARAQRRSLLAGGE